MVLDLEKFQLVTEVPEQNLIPKLRTYGIACFCYSSVATSYWDISGFSLGRKEDDVTSVIKKLISMQSTVASLDKCLWEKIHEFKKLLAPFVHQHEELSEDFISP